MAVISSLPGVDIISGFKGVLDFYVCLGLPCVRKWPRYKTRAPHPEEAVNQAIFSDAVAEWDNLSALVRDAYKAMASGSTLSGRDMFVKMYINASLILPY